VQAHHGAMMKGTRWTEGEAVELTRAFIGRISTHLGTNMRGAAFYAGVHVDFLGARTRHSATLDDPRYWHSRSMVAVRARWFDVIAPLCTKMSACYKFVKSKPHTGMTELDLQHMTIAEMNGIRAPEFQADVPGSWGEFCSFVILLDLAPPPALSRRGPTWPGTGTGAAI